VNGPWVHALAPAKVNLTLAVLARRTDGYHDIHSWMLALDLCDRLAVRATDSGAVRLRVGGPAATDDVPADARNLAVRAAQAALDRARGLGVATLARGLEIELEKAIPSRAGLGGGSADAAAAWMAACVALGIDPTHDAGERLLAQLGSDCVFFQKASRGIGIATGRGERVEGVEAPPPSWSIALATPGCGAATAAVYARALPRDPGRPTLRPRFTEPASDACGSIDNDLEAAAIAALPTLGAWRSLLDDTGCASWRLCGSGSSWYGIYDDDAAARAALDRVESGAGQRELGLRLARVVHAAGHGARLDLES
jgi:4-diphosphocytidyl-2-C-methyl-D-erythritol kinase